MLTEEQAKKKWCPFARVSLPSNGTGNRVSTFHRELAARSAARGDKRDLDHYEQQMADCNCIGSACMAWRTLPYNADNPKISYTGYCGLAGNPMVQP